MAKGRERERMSRRDGMSRRKQAAEKEREQGIERGEEESRIDGGRMGRNKGRENRRG